MSRLLLFLLIFFGAEVRGKSIQHYVYFELERERIREQSFLETKQFIGAQLKYTWDELEPQKDQYRLELIESDLAFLQSQGKKLFIQVQDLSFNMARKPIPAYLLTEPEFNGGAAIHYVGEGEAAKPEGWIARRWDRAVRNRFLKLLSTIGKGFDGRIAGINLPETAFSVSETMPPSGFTPAIYRDAILEQMKGLKESFPKSVAMQYANFMPGEWLPEENHGFLGDVYSAGVRWNVAMGGPDLLPYKKGQWNHAYRFLPEVAEKVPTGIAVQWDNYKHVNPVTGKAVTIEELYTFASQNLNVDFIFWCTQEPYYTERVIPYLQSR